MAASQVGLIVDEQLDEELHKPVIKKLKKEKPMEDLTTILGQHI